MSKQGKPRSADQARSAVYVALLRGVNVGGKRKLPMANLVRVFQDAGCTNVRTYIQSGNVVFESPSTTIESVSSSIEKELLRKMGFNVPIVIRTAAELAKVARSNPYLSAGSDEKLLYVIFLANKPTRAQIGSLDPHRSPGDLFQVVGSEIYLHFPNGTARSKLTVDYFDGKLDTISTMRNWRTVLSLIEMTDQRA